MGRWDGLNRRKFPRVNYPCLIVIKGEEDGKNDKQALLAHTENIGVGGICVILKKNLKMFSEVELELDLLDLGNHIKCKGKVVWNVRRKMNADRKPLFYDIGIEFDHIQDKDQERLTAVVQKLIDVSDKNTPIN